MLLFSNTKLLPAQTQKLTMNSLKRLIASVLIPVILTKALSVLEPPPFRCGAVKTGFSRRGVG
jgi:hypothetical protein